MKRTIGLTLAAFLTALSVQAVIGTAQAAPSGQPSSPSTNPTALAVAAADHAAASGLDALRKGPDEQFNRRAVYKGGIPGHRDLYYVSYDRTYRGLPVIGGDAVVATDAAGNTLDTVAADKGDIAVNTAATVTDQRAADIAKAQLSQVTKVVSNTLSVLAGGSGTLVYETVVSGYRNGVPSRLHVYVNANTGKVEGSRDDSAAGSGTSQWNGPNPLHLDTSNNSTVDSTRPGLQCVDLSTSQPFTESSNSFGDGNASNRETGCADVLWSTQHEWDMLKNWLGRTGIDGNGNGFTVMVGLDQVNAFWTGDHIEIGHNQAGQWIGAMDVVGHEHGHAIDQYTPGGAGSEAGLGEGTGDIFGALTEAYTNEPAPFDTPDYTVGESVNLTGNGPIRDMANPSRINNDPNCYSSAIPGTEVHAAAGPLNHWFYLLAEGSAASPTCNNSTETGIGIKAAGQVFYNAMLLKTSGMTYFRYRTATLKAAKNLDPTCAQFNAVKAAWNAVSVPAQSGDPTCTGTPGNDFSLALNPSAGSVQAGSSATSQVSTTTTSGSAQTVALTASGQPRGVTVSFDPSSVTSGGTSTMTVATNASVAAGTYTITVQGAGTVSHTATYNLTVGGQPPTDDFSVTLNPASGSTAAGGSVTSTVGTSTTTGNAQTVKLNATGLPTGATATFNPSSVTSGSSSTLTIATTASIAAGTYNISVTGTGAGVVHAVTFALTVTGGGPGGCGTVPAWSSAQSYVPGDEVSHNGHKFKSTWYSTGAEPGAPGSWAVWQDEGAC
ncbi:Leupeptin-inactivating enzyme 2 [Solihabitans fulvus]|uniref:Leupeptin-inactivating enzyme 2 n=1 Tax=Solihabitans fulvus TaxID=1892852 RepID=A0A5B2XB60_9PSEU|nr:M4 family metallopeptidase [Solihabitans fulvus]KAA2260463.1 Leupeptin-inactivating enzyme 2 [Solihabitans fulvus]